MKENDVAVLSHGATGRGNDQMRFERYTNVLAPNMSVYAPWRDAELLEEFPGRTEMAAYLNKVRVRVRANPNPNPNPNPNQAREAAAASGAPRPPHCTPHGAKG